jgi:hypothetical protein
MDALLLLKFTDVLAWPNAARPVEPVLAWGRLAWAEKVVNAIVFFMYTEKIRSEYVRTQGPSGF